MKKKFSLFIIAALALSSLALLQGCADLPEDGAANGTSPVTSEVPAAIGEAVEEPVAPASTTPVSTVSMLNDNPGYQAFLSLNAGMTKEEVDTALGEGTKMETDAFGGGVEKYEYSKDGQLMWISFRDGKMISKGTANIKDWNAEISPETFALLKNDMTLEEVVALLGEGQLMNENHQFAESLKEIRKTIFWNVKSDYQNIKLTFKNDKVSYISDMNMD